jgi:hypothetical protein
MGGLFRGDREEAEKLRKILGYRQPRDILCPCQPIVSNSDSLSDVCRQSCCPPSPVFNVCVPCVSVEVGEFSNWASYSNRQQIIRLQIIIKSGRYVRGRRTKHEQIMILAYICLHQSLPLRYDPSGLHRSCLFSLQLAATVFRVDGNSEIFALWIAIYTTTCAYLVFVQVPPFILALKIYLYCTVARAVVHRKLFQLEWNH